MPEGESDGNFSLLKLKPLRHSIQAQDPQDLKCDGRGQLCAFRRLSVLGSDIC